MIYDCRPFKLERYMLPLVRHSLRRLLNVALRTTVKVVQEPTIGAVIPDLLVGIVNRSAPIIARNHFTTIESSILSLLEERGDLEPEEIQNALFLLPSMCERGIRKLQQTGAIRRGVTGNWEIQNSARTSGIEIVAVEAKLNSWRRALEQAESYYAFADRAYVLLDGNQVHISEQMHSDFQLAGVGLWLQHGRATSEIIPIGTKPRTASPDRVRAVEKLLRARNGLRVTPSQTSNRHPALVCS